MGFNSGFKGLITFAEIIAVYIDNFNKHINAFCIQNSEPLWRDTKRGEKRLLYLEKLKADLRYMRLACGLDSSGSG